jgi:steroid 5-alpha reductase family enzyme
MDLATVLGNSGIAIGVAMLALWLLSLRLRDASIVDPFWGAGFVLVAWLSFWGSSGDPARRALALALVTVWGLRLSIHLLARNLGHGEDPRYRAMRAAHGGRFWLVSLGTVFGFQGLLMWLISLPVQVAVASPAPRGLGWLDAAGAALWAVGFLFEAVGDWQLRRFRADPRNRGRVLETGLWRYTRHPNYFGDAVVWWAFFSFAAATAGGEWTVFSPVVMTVLLMRVSGVTLLERKLRETKPAYRRYAEETSAFFPWPPRRREGTDG